MKRLSSLSIVFPSYNDAQVLLKLIQRADRVAHEVADRHEIIVVNDFSCDNTNEVLDRLEKKYPHLKSIRHKKNLGYGGAVTSGLKQAKYEWVFYTDGDLQYEPAQIKVLVDKVGREVDVINGYKLNREDSKIRKSLGSLYNFILHRMYTLPIRDIDCDFRLIRKSHLEKINILSTSAVFCLELVLKLKAKGARFVEVGVNHYKRPYGKSKFFRPKHILKTIVENVTFYLRYQRLHRFANRHIITTE